MRFLVIQVPLYRSVEDEELDGREVPWRVRSLPSTLHAVEVEALVRGRWGAWQLSRRPQALETRERK